MKAKGELLIDVDPVILPENYKRPVKGFRIDKGDQYTWNLDGAFTHGEESVLGIMEKI